MIGSVCLFFFLILFVELMSLLVVCLLAVFKRLPFGCYV